MGFVDFTGFLLADFAGFLLASFAGFLLADLFVVDRATDFASALVAGFVFVDEPEARALEDGASRVGPRPLAEATARGALEATVSGTVVARVLAPPEALISRSPLSSDSG